MVYTWFSPWEAFTQKIRSPTQLCCIWILQDGPRGTVLFNSCTGDYSDRQLKIKTADSEDKQKEYQTFDSSSLSYSLIGVVMCLHFSFTMPQLGWGEVYFPHKGDLHLLLFARTVKILILHWHRIHSWMLKAFSVRNSTDLPCTLHYFSLVPSWWAHHNLSI